MSDKAHLACSYAVLLLHDEGLQVNAANIQKVLDAARVANVEKFMPKLYASNVTSAVIASTIATGGSSSGAPAGAASSAPAAKTEAPKDDKKPKVEEKKVEKEPEEDLDMGDLFG